MTWKTFEATRRRGRNMSIKAYFRSDDDDDDDDDDYECYINEDVPCNV